MNFKIDKVFIYENTKLKSVNGEKMNQLIKALGYYKYRENTKDSFEVVRLIDNIISFHNIASIIDSVKEWMYSNKATSAQINLMIKYKPEINWLEEIKPKIAFGDKNTAYQYFTNNVLKITKNKKELIPYSSLNNHVFIDQIKNFSITQEHLKSNEWGGEYYEFIQMICGNDLNRTRSLISIIGKFLHNFKDSANEKVLIISDANLDMTNRGGTGKSLFAQILKRATYSIMMDGKNFNNKKQFNLDRIDRGHQLVIVDDVDNSFSFQDMYSKITGDLEVGKKYKKTLNIEFEESPRFIITTNYHVNSDGSNSDKRRRIDFEMDSKFSKKYTPMDHFKHRLFDDWDNVEMSIFYNFLANSIQFYLKNGVIEPLKINFVKNQIISQCGESFFEFSELLTVNEKYNKSKLFEYFVRSKNSKGLTSITFKKYLDNYAEAKNAFSHHIESNGSRYWIYTDQENINQAKVNSKYISIDILKSRE